MATEPLRRFQNRRFLHFLAAAYAVVWIITAIRPLDRGDWFIENLLVFAAVPVLILTYRRRPLSDASYLLLAIFLALHAIGAHYTYAKVPLGDWMKEALAWDRNHFDRLVHCLFGLLLLFPVREVLLRTVGARGFWSYALSFTVIVSASGFFEIVEAIVAQIVSPELGIAYLGTQGDQWDAQKDMAAAVAGAVCSSVFLAAIATLRGRKTNPPPG
jgi:putative membrane protein